jgi:hypothetical protein
MRRFMVLVTMVLLMMAMLVASAAPALAVAGPPARSGSVGTPVDPAACESPAGISPFIGWRNGTCWVLHP